MQGFRIPSAFPAQPSRSSSHKREAGHRPEDGDGWEPEQWGGKPPFVGVMAFLRLPGEGGTWPQMGVTQGCKLWVVRGINAARVMLGVTNNCKVCSEMSRCPGNTRPISAFRSQNWLFFFFLFNRGKLPIAGASGTCSQGLFQLFLDWGLSLDGSIGALSSAGLCSTPGGAMWVPRGHGVGGPGAVG